MNCGHVWIRVSTNLLYCTGWFHSLTPQTTEYSMLTTITPNSTLVTHNTRPTVRTLNSQLSTSQNLSLIWFPMENINNKNPITWYSLIFSLLFYIQQTIQQKSNNKNNFYSLSLFCPTHTHTAKPPHRTHTSYSEILYFIQYKLKQPET